MDSKNLVNRFVWTVTINILRKLPPKNNIFRNVTLIAFSTDSKDILGYFLIIWRAKAVLFKRLVKFIQIHQYYYGFKDIV